MEKYCKSEFSLFDEFKPNEFKIIDFLRENTSFLREHTDAEKKIDEDFLDAFRYIDLRDYSNVFNQAIYPMKAQMYFSNY